MILRKEVVYKKQSGIEKIFIFFSKTRIKKQMFPQNMEIISK